VQFQDVFSSEISIGRQFGSNLVVKLNDGSGQINLQNWFVDTTAFSSMAFADGLSLSAGDLGTIAQQNLSLNGTNGVDVLTGDDFDHVYSTGTDDDIVTGGIADDTYIFQSGDGHDTISDTGGSNLIQFGPGIDPDQVRVFSETSGAGTVTKIHYGAGDEVIVTADGEGTGIIFLTFQFDGNVQKTYDELVEQSGGPTTVAVGGGSVGLYGSGRQDNLIGGTGSDYLLGGIGNDFLQGGAGNDTIDPQDIGSNTYMLTQWLNSTNTPDNNILYFNKGDGNDSIIYRNATRGIDSIVFGAGINPSDVKISLIDLTPETLYQYHVFEGASFFNYSDSPQLSQQNETWWAQTAPVYYQAYLDGFNSFALGDTFRSTYQIDYGDHDSIQVTFDGASPIAKVFFPDGLSLQIGDLSRIAGRNYWTLDGVQQQSGMPRYLGDNFNHTLGGRVFDIPEINGYVPYGGPYGGLASYEDTVPGFSLSAYDSYLYDFNSFAVATEGLNVTAFGTITGTAFADSISGSASNDVLRGRGGDDTLAAGDGGDILDGGRGNDSLAGGQGGDTYRYALTDGADTITEQLWDSGNDVIEFGLDITPESLTLGVDGAGNMVIHVGDSPADQITLTGFNQYNAASTGTVELFRFSDGTELTYSDLIARGFTILADGGFDLLTGTSVNDVIVGGSGVNLFEGLAGDDILVGGSGFNSFRLRRAGSRYGF
jgi:Ca2+-binding RTX toxin-like protein